MAEWQLRDYRIADGHFDDFIRAWTAGVLPLRRAFGFRVEAWAVREESRFVWLLAYGGPGTFEAANEAYYASPERSAVDPDPAQWIADQQVTMLEPVIER
jgi:hypothetical protein